MKKNKTDNDGEMQINESKQQYRVLQIILKEKLAGKGSKNYNEIEELCNQQFQEGYRLHTFSQSTAHSKGFGGGDRVVCNLIFERIV